jgi:hypothetical protein
MSCLGSEIHCRGNHRNSVWSRVNPRQRRVKPRQLFLGGGFLPRPNTLMLASDSSRREFASSWIALCGNDQIMETAQTLDTETATGVSLMRD